jgi:hypothetical protein
VDVDVGDERDEASVWGQAGFAERAGNMPTRRRRSSRFDVDEPRAMDAVSTISDR